MNPSYKLKTSQVKQIVAATFPDYKGRKYSIEFRPTVTFCDMSWGGGTRNRYIAVKSDGQIASVPAPAPWINPLEGRTVEIPADVIVVEHSYFCGQDCGIRLYAHPCNMPLWITGPEEGTK